MTEIKNEAQNLIDDSNLKMAQALSHVDKDGNVKMSLADLQSFITDSINSALHKDESKSAEMDLDKKQNGEVKRTNSNLQQILQFDPHFKGKLGYNLSTQEYMIREDIKLPSKNSNGESIDTIIPAGELDDKDLDMIIGYLSRSKNYKLETNRNDLMTAMTCIQEAQKFDPLRDYFDNLKWDHKDRIGHVMQDYLGAEDSEFNKFQIKLWLMGAVSKVYNKKQKFDFCLDLVGGQGAGKTTFLQTIAPLDMYVQDFPDFSSKDTKLMMKGALIANDDEMTATKESTFEQIKSFITATDLKFRAPYGRLPIHINKSFVLARTGNEIQHLADPSGQRRFLCVQCGVNDEHKIVKRDMKQSYVDQLWAQAKCYYEKAKKSGNLFYLTEEQNKMLHDGRQMFIKQNATQDMVADLIKNELSNTNFISNSDMHKLAAHKLNKDKIGISDKEKRSLRTQMAHSGWLASAVGWDPEVGQSVRGYKRISKIKVNHKLYGVKEWITEECDRGTVTNGKQRPVTKKPVNYAGQTPESYDKTYSYNYDNRKQDDVQFADDQVKQEMTQMKGQN